LSSREAFSAATEGLGWLVFHLYNTWSGTRVGLSVTRKGLADPMFWQFKESSKTPHDHPY